MKKNLLKFSFLIATLFYSLQSFSQTGSIYGIGTNVLNLGLGVGYSVSYISGANSSPVLSASFEHGVSKLGPGTLGIGGIISYQGSSYSFSDGFGDSYKETWHTTYIALRGTWHPDFLVADKYDVYGALQLGYVNYGYSSSASGPYVNTALNNSSNSLASGLALGLAVGGRYYLTKRVALFGELGYDICYLKVGASVKF